PQSRRAFRQAARRRTHRCGAVSRRSLASPAAPAHARRRDEGAVMIWRLLHIVVLAALVLAAADVYKIKYESTLQAERVAKLRGEVRREEDMIATLRADWSKLDRPDRIQDLAQRHLT